MVLKQSVNLCKRSSGIFYEEGAPVSNFFPQAELQSKLKALGSTRPLVVGLWLPLRVLIGQEKAFLVAPSGVRARRSRL
ncbi:hypothetical protein FQA47_025485 [Oryzias melastigma]|uniref:Uncharacterized protein n=1 Tax=Oryzias melastigma TaxID=30732 RepID=A0A834BUQ6_ORYME|nr:hypothetical protein FQA47_025485 [Oryzias melastigma]